ncbi:glpV, partial [Symbiodinium sp. CCMP2456]
DLLHLEGHHSRPAYKESSQLMGKKAQWEESWHGGWQQYHGASGSRQHKGYGKGKQAKDGKRWREPQEDTAQGFPSFEEMKIKNKGDRTHQRQETMDVDESEPSAGGYLRGFQKILNGLRKAETRARKLEQECQDTDDKWAAFQQSLKDSYVKERAKHREKIGRLRAELSEQNQAKEDIVRELKKVVANPTVIMAPKDKDLENAEALEELEQLLAAPTRSSSGEGLADLLAGVVRDGLTGSGDSRQRLLDALASHGKSAEAPRTPPRRTLAYADKTPPAKTSQRAQVKEEIEDHEGKGGTPERSEVPFVGSPSLTGLIPETTAASIKEKLEEKRRLATEEEEDSDVEFLDGLNKQEKALDFFGVFQEA